MSLSLLVAGVLLQVDTSDLVRKYPDEQVLKMGRAKWIIFYTEKEGSSSADMMTAEGMFGRALERKNNVRLKPMPSATRTRIAALRKSATSYRSAMVDVARAFSGGGTIWNLVSSGTLAHREEMVAKLLTQPVRSPGARVVSMVTRELDAVERRAQRRAKEVDELAFSGGGTKAIREGLRVARAEFAKGVAIAAKRPRAESDVILDFYLEQAKLPGSMGEDGS